MIHFSVVIPAFNAEKTLERAIRSVLNQSLPALEIIVVDDGSEDGTFQLAKQFEPSVIVARLPLNQGVSSARNHGWALAKGEYLAFLDSDDEWHPQKLASLSEVILKFPKTDFIAHPFSLSNPNWKMPLKIKIQKIKFSSLLLKNRFQGSCICIRKDLILRFDTKMRYSEDYDLALRASFSYHCLEINEPLTRLGRPQLSKGGISAHHWKMRKGELRTYSKLRTLNPLFTFLLPFLWMFSLLKYLKKSVD